MGTSANLIAIKDGTDYHTLLTTDGYMSEGGVSFIALAKYNKDVLFELIKANATHSLKMYQLGSVLPYDDDYKLVHNSSIEEEYPMGKGELFEDRLNVFSPLGQSTLNYDTLSDGKNIFKYANEYSNGNNIVTETNMRTYIIDFDDKCLKIYGENIGVERVYFRFSELEFLNADIVIKNIINCFDCEDRSEAYLLDAIKQSIQVFKTTIELLEKSKIDTQNFKKAYLQTIKIWNESYTKDEVIDGLGLRAEYDEFLKI